jgi:hypothetical protein
MTIQIDRRTLLAGLAGSLSLPAFAQDPGSVTIYTSNNQQAVQAITDEARTKLSGLKLNFITGGSGQLLRRMEAEAARPQADIFWSSSANTLGAFKGLYEPYVSPQLGAIAPNLRDPANLWTASNLHVVVQMVNINQLAGQPAPKTWPDLFNPAFKGKTSILNIPSIGIMDAAMIMEAMGNITYADKGNMTKAEIDATIESRYEASCRDVMEILKSAGNLPTLQRFSHPWFGPLGCPRVGVDGFHAHGKTMDARHSQSPRWRFGVGVARCDSGRVDFPHLRCEFLRFRGRSTRFP